MEKKDLRHLSRSELIDLLFEVTNGQGEDGAQNRSDYAKAIAEEHSRIHEKKRFRRILRSTFTVLLAVAAIAVLVSTLFLPVIEVSGDSMEPTLSNGDILLLFNTKHYERGELACVAWQNKLLLKRVIALGGDTVEIRKNGDVYVNEIPLEEPYLIEKSLGECDITFPYIVPEGKVFVLGDRRDISIDSRSSAVGCADYDQMVGRVLFRVWPFGSLKKAT